MVEATATPPFFTDVTDCALTMVNVASAIASSRIVLVASPLIEGPLVIVIFTVNVVEPFAVTVNVFVPTLSVSIYAFLIVSVFPEKEYSEDVKPSTVTLVVLSNVNVASARWSAAIDTVEAPLMVGTAAASITIETVNVVEPFAVMVSVFVPTDNVSIYDLLIVSVPLANE